jgi:hypothetical protein
MFGKIHQTAQGWLKYLALLVLFNSRPAAIATFVVPW